MAVELPEQPIGVTQMGSIRDVIRSAVERVLVARERLEMKRPIYENRLGAPRPARRKAPDGLAPDPKAAFA